MSHYVTISHVKIPNVHMKVETHSNVMSVLDLSNYWMALVLTAH